MSMLRLSSLVSNAFQIYSCEIEMCYLRVSIKRIVPLCTLSLSPGNNDTFVWNQIAWVLLLLFFFFHILNYNRYVSFSIIHTCVGLTTLIFLHRRKKCGIASGSTHFIQRKLLFCIHTSQIDGIFRANYITLQNDPLSVYYLSAAELHATLKILLRYTTGTSEISV